eukprot:s980_g19.t1
MPLNLIKMSKSQVTFTSLGTEFAVQELNFLCIVAREYIAIAMYSKWKANTSHTLTVAKGSQYDIPHNETDDIGNAWTWDMLRPQLDF